MRQDWLPIPEVQVALQITLTLASVALVVSIAEDMSLRRLHDDDGLLSWPIERSRSRWTLTGKLAAGFDRVFAEKKYRRLLQGALVLLGVLVITVWLAPRAVILPGVLAAVFILMNYIRNPYGTDGTDQLLFITFLIASLALFASGEARRMLILFLCAQLWLSYFISGLAKLASPKWRGGDALVGILSTRAYGNPRLYGLIRDRRLVNVALCWSVIAGEALCPILILFVAPGVALLILALGLSFHLGTAVVMGLNNFLLSFGAVYPVLASVTLYGSYR